MRLVKLFALAALATAVAAGFIGASSASAEFSTQLCKVHEEKLTCPPGQAVTEDHQVLAPGTLWRLLSTFVTVLCLEVLKLATPLGLGNPQEVHTLVLEFGGCGTNSEHNNCEVVAEKLPLLSLLKTGLDQGVLTALDGSLLVICENPDIECLYDLAGMSLSMGKQHTTADKVPLTELGSKFLCPDKPTLDFLLVTLKGEEHYILQ